MICPYCGKTIENDWNFCPVCERELPASLRKGKKTVLEKRDASAEIKEEKPEKALTAGVSTASGAVSHEGAEPGPLPECPACGHVSPQGSNFCAKCFKKLGEARPAGPEPGFAVQDIINSAARGFNRLWAALIPGKNGRAGVEKNTQAKSSSNESLLREKLKTFKPYMAKSVAVIAAAAMLGLFVVYAMPIIKNNLFGNIYTWNKEQSPLELEHPFKKDFVISPDKKAYAYVAADPDAMEYAVIVKKDETIIGKKYSRVIDLAIANWGRQYAFIGAINKNITLRGAIEGFAVINGEEIKKHEYISTLRLSRDGKHYGYRAAEGGTWKDGSYNGGKYFAVINGVEGKRYDGIWDYQMSADGRHYGYYAGEGGRWKDGNYIGGKLFAVINGVEGKRYSYMKEFAVSRCGCNYIYVASNSTDYGINAFIVINGISQKEKFYDLRNMSKQDWTNSFTYEVQLRANSTWVSRETPYPVRVSKSEKISNKNEKYSANIKTESGRSRLYIEEINR